MQSLVSLWKSFSVYLASAGAGTSKAAGARREIAEGGTAGGEASKGETSGKPASFCAGVSKSEGLLGTAERGGFLQQGAIVAEQVIAKLLQTGWLTRWV